MTKASENSYKAVVAAIKNLHWKSLEPDALRQLMCLAYYAATEFAGALRIAGQLYSNNRNVQELVQGELQTENLAFGTYRYKGDHAAFIYHFMEEGNIHPSPEVAKAGETYWKFCCSLPSEVRAMSVFSREKELPEIFARILEAPDWSGPGLEAYRFFLESHIRLDSEEGGHQDLTKEFPVDDRVLGFYEARLAMYKSLPQLFRE